MTSRELRRLLENAGCTIRPGTRHDKVYLGSRQTAIPRHGTDMGPYLINKIFKDLGIERKK